ncbi:MAG TPA: 50S ribosomal protein L24 [Candidatus Kapabacteria bacterium]|nr:50S ribosomal protein L24 [Candidatus Kapabacteria bacterium]
MRIKKNDEVEVITGRNRGRRGKVLRVFPETNKVLVEGVNILKKHERPSQANQQGGISEKEHPIHVSNVMLVDPKSGARTRIGRKVATGENGKLSYERVAKKSGDVIA